MKTRFPLLFLLQWLVLPLFALEFSSNASLYDHLLEINPAWCKQVSPPSSGEYVYFDSDQARIQTHLQWVEAALRTRDLSNLTEAARVNRQRHLDRLNAYRNARQFPANQYHDHRQPYFRDSYGVLCAVGYLLWQDGQYELVQRINRENNYAYIAELARQYPDIEAWAGANGFTVAELAWIQPGYDPVKPQLSNWGNGAGLNAGGRINAMTKTGAETLLFVAGSFSEIDGLAANSIAAWDGAAWSALGGGVVGEVFALAYFQGNIYTGHQFEENGPSMGIYVLKGGLWFEHPCFEMGDNTIHGFTKGGAGALMAYGGFSAAGMIAGRGASVFMNDDPYSRGYLLGDSTVRAMLTFQGHLYMAGDFQHLFNDPYPGLARASLLLSPADEPMAALPVQVTAQAQQLTLRYEALRQVAQLTVYDLHGRLLAQRTLHPGAGEEILLADDWASGLYIWHLRNTEGAQTGKWVVAH